MRPGRWEKYSPVSLHFIQYTYCRHFKTYVLSVSKHCTLHCLLTSNKYLLYKRFALSTFALYITYGYFFYIVKIYITTLMRMRSANLLLASALLFVSAAYAQNVGIGTTTPAAKLDITSTNSGVLVPRVALTGNNDASTVPSPANSLLIYNTATVTGAHAINPGYYYWSSTLTSWNKIIDASSLTGITTNTLGSSVNTITSTVNGVAATAPAVNTVGNTSSANNLSTTVNGVAGATVTMVNTHTATWTQGAGLSDAANGVSSNITPASGTVSNLLGYNAAGAPVYQSVSTVLGGGTTVSNTSSANTLSTTVDGVTGATVPMVNSVSNASSANTLLTTVNGVAGSTVPIINTHTATWTQSAGLSDAANGVSSNITPPSGTVSNILGYNAAGAPVYQSVSTVLGGATTVSNTSSANNLSTTVDGVTGATVTMINSHTLTNPTNTITSTVNGVSATASAVNTVANTSSANTILTTVNGVAGSTVPIINTNVLSLSGSTLTETINGVASNGLNIATATNNIYNTDGTLTGNRTVTMAADNLTFSSTTGNLIFNPSSTGAVGIGNAAPGTNLLNVSSATANGYGITLNAETGASNNGGGSVNINAGQGGAPAGGFPGGGSVSIVAGPGATSGSVGTTGGNVTIAANGSSYCAGCGLTGGSVNLYSGGPISGSSLTNGNINFYAGYATPTQVMSIVGSNNSVLIKGNNSNSSATAVSALELMTGRTNASALVSGQSNADIAIQYGGGGYRHFIASRHNAVASSNQNAIDFYLNNSTSSTGSSAPGTGNVEMMSITATGVGIGTSAPSNILTVTASGASGLTLTGLTSAYSATTLPMGLNSSGVVVDGSRHTYTTGAVYGSWNGNTGKQVGSFTATGRPYLVIVNASQWGTSTAIHYPSLSYGGGSSGTQITAIAPMYYNETSSHKNHCTSTVYTFPAGTVNLYIWTGDSSDSNDSANVTVVEL